MSRDRAPVPQPPARVAPKVALAARLRIFPAMAGAAACLLVIKGMAYLRDPAPPLVQTRAGDLPEFARVLAKARQGYIPPDADITGSADVKKDKKADDKASIETAKLEAAKAQPKEQLVPNLPPEARPGRSSPAERALLERLGERREEIEGRNREADTREALLKAAERKLDGRVSDLKMLEEKIQASADSKEQSQAQTLKNIVMMYETMKPKDAARVFDRLDLKVLVPVVLKIAPRKMAEILSSMTPETAERLTIALATRGEGVEPALPTNELQRLDAPAVPVRP